MRFHLHTTLSEKYDPAMKITDQAEADAYFEELVKHCMLLDKTMEEAEKIERSNLGYYAGYCDDATRERVERLFSCEHPIFGKIKDNGPPTQREAFMSGLIASSMGVEKARQCFK